ncbi:MAG TPA: hypothetical protein VEB18_00585 [Candidatus Paceibacterota bacterium]|nr:hypothetical protein [Candidatus Paceibacterota bacterium]
MDPLAKLFGSAARIKLLRLFLFNEENTFTIADAAKRTKISKDAARREIQSLAGATILKKKTGKGGAVFSANVRFPHYEPLRTFLRTSSGVDDASISSNLKKAGTLRLVALSGLFTGVPESKVDILIVGDRLDERTLATVVHSLEAELGRELRYACFSTEDFRYRVGVYDRLVRDVLDYPHRVVIDKIGI